MSNPCGSDLVNLIDSPFMPVGVNSSHVKREQANGVPLAVEAGRRSATLNPANPYTMEASPMLNRTSLRAWATPLTIGTFVLMAGTGILMFFDVVPGSVTFVHQWLSWLFLVGVVAHILVNYRSFLRHLSSGWGRASLIVFTTAMVVSTISFGQITGPQLKWPISQALVDARLSVLADLTRTDNAQLLHKLAAHGVSADADQTVKEIAAKNGMDDFHILGLIFLKGTESTRP